MATLGGARSDGSATGWARVHKRWLLLNAVAIPAVINAGSSAAIAWLSLGGEHRVPVWSLPLVDKPGLVTDTLGTFFILPFLTTLTIGLAVQAAQRAGRLPPLLLPQRWEAEAAQLPARLLRRSGLLAVIVLIVLGPVAVVALASSGFKAGVQPSTFVVYKAVLGLGLGAVFSPFVAVMAMAAADRRRVGGPLTRPEGH